MIEFSCTCGKALRAPDGSEGRKAKCPKCAEIVTVPTMAVYELDLVPREEPVARAPATVHQAPSRGPTIAVQEPIYAAPTLARIPPPKPGLVRSYAYLALLLALIPLLLFVLMPDTKMNAEVHQALASHMDEIDQAIEHGIVRSEGDVKAMLLADTPYNRLPSALLSYNSKAHWLIGLATAAFFFGFLMLALPQSIKYRNGVLFAGLFTGTVGIVLLLFFQWAADGMPFIIPRGIIGMVLLVVKLIGYSYKLAEGDTNFFLSFIGFTFGVGLCEEATKAIPALLRVRPTPGKADASWHGLLLWGLASGFGFGIAEGIMYAGRDYNGFAPSDLYYVRFFSCVALHAMWAGAVSISIYRNQHRLTEADNGWMYCFLVMVYMFVPMVLHGLYDTLLKKEMEVPALLVAIFSFGWLVFQVERQRRDEPLGVATSMA